MISKVKVGRSFSGIMNYLLQDKINQSQTRGTIFQFNNCFGSKNELVQQFVETSKLSKRIEKPVWHCSFSFSPNDTVTENIMREISLHFSDDFKFNDHQWISVLHEDTPSHAHFHMVINRVNPLTGKSVSDSHNFKRMMNFCRKMEKKYNLEEVQNPEHVLKNPKSLTSSKDNRKVVLKQTIKEVLIDCKSFTQFVERINNKGFQTEIARGIAFTDKKKVRFKGSQVGFSLDEIKRHIERNTLKQNNQSLRI